MNGDGDCVLKACGELIDFCDTCNPPNGNGAIECTGCIGDLSITTFDGNVDNACTGVCLDTIPNCLAANCTGPDANGLFACSEC